MQRKMHVSVYPYLVTDLVEAVISVWPNTLKILFRQL